MIQMTAITRRQLAAALLVVLSGLGLAAWLILDPAGLAAITRILGHPIMPWPLFPGS